MRPSGTARLSTSEKDIRNLNTNVKAAKNNKSHLQEAAPRQKGLGPVATKRQSNEDLNGAKRPKRAESKPLQKKRKAQGDDEPRAKKAKVPYPCLDAMLLLTHQGKPSESEREEDELMPDAKGSTRPHRSVTAKRPSASTASSKTAGGVQLLKACGPPKPTPPKSPVFSFAARMAAEMKAESTAAQEGKPRASSGSHEKPDEVENSPEETPTRPSETANRQMHGPRGHTDNSGDCVSSPLEKEQLEPRRESSSSVSTKSESTMGSKSESTAQTTPELEGAEQQDKCVAQPKVAVEQKDEADEQKIQESGKEQEDAIKGQQSTPIKRRGDALVKPLGIRNYKNACYINSAVQALACVPEMVAHYEPMAHKTIAEITAYVAQAKADLEKGGSSTRRKGNKRDDLRAMFETHRNDIECGGTESSEALVLKETAPYAFINVDRTIATEKKKKIGLKKNLASLRTPAHGKVDLIFEEGSVLYKLIATMKHHGAG
ncbi:hypothetical protein P7C71_g5172, partial [Lecanoromycetidae sp. Uapishka_2]